MSDISPTNQITEKESPEAAKDAGYLERESQTSGGPSKITPKTEIRPALRFKNARLSAIELKVGFGYNIGKDSIAYGCLFNLGESQGERVKNWHIPEFVQVCDIRESISRTYHFKDMKEYREKRVGMLDAAFNLQAAMYGIPIQTKPGVHVSYGRSQGNADAYETETTINEYRLYKFSIELHPGKTKLHREFIDALKNLPNTEPPEETLDEKITLNPGKAPTTIQDSNNVQVGPRTDDEQRWQQFFDFWGTHVVLDSYGGGSFTLTTSSRVSKSTLGKAWRGRGEVKVETPPVGVDTGATGEVERTQEGTQEKRNVSFAFEGGEIEKHSVATQKEWLSTVSATPDILTTSLKLIPLSTLLSHYKYHELADIMDAQIKRYYEDYNPRPQTSPPPSKFSWSCGIFNK